MGQVVHKKPQNCTEVVLRSGHRYLYRNRRLGVTVAAREKKQAAQLCITATLIHSVRAFIKHGRQTYNLCMRETMVLNAAWMSAVVQVQTTGRWWFCSMSERY